LFPGSILNPYTTYSEKLSDLVGSYNGFTIGTHPLIGATTATLPATSLGSLLSVVLTGADAYPMMLGAGTAVTNVPLTVQPSDFSSTNQVTYALQNWHSAANYVEGVSGAGFFSLQAQVVTPANPVYPLLRVWNNGTAIVMSSSTGSLVLPVSGNVSRNLPYSPTTPTAWNGAPPTTVQQALDRLAAVASSKP
jgi:hypothetical protein